MRQKRLCSTYDLVRVLALLAVLEQDRDVILLHSLVLGHLFDSLVIVRVVSLRYRPVGHLDLLLHHWFLRLYYCLLWLRLHLGLRLFLTACFLVSLWSRDCADLASAWPWEGVLLLAVELFDDVVDLRLIEVDVGVLERRLQWLGIGLERIGAVHLLVDQVVQVALLAELFQVTFQLS